MKFVYAWIASDFGRGRNLSLVIERESTRFTLEFDEDLIVKHAQFNPSPANMRFAADLIKDTKGDFVAMISEIRSLGFGYDKNILQSV